MQVRPCKYGHTEGWYQRDGRDYNCRRCSIERAKVWHKRNAGVRNAIRRRYRLGVEAPYPAPAACELCGGPPNGVGGLHLDHDHDTKKFRGWLCMKCNQGIGLLGDDAEGLRRALAYLAREHL